jgi:hypothetical protein
LVAIAMHVSKAHDQIDTRLLHLEATIVAAAPEIFSGWSRCFYADLRKIFVLTSESLGGLNGRG